jgi:hypothetical protein
LREVEPEDDEEILDLLRQVILQMDVVEEVNHQEVERAAEQAAHEAGIPAVNDPFRRAQAQHIRNVLRANMPPGGRHNGGRN